MATAFDVLREISQAAEPAHLDPRVLSRAVDLSAQLFLASLQDGEADTLRNLAHQLIESASGHASPRDSWTSSESFAVLSMLGTLSLRLAQTLGPRQAADALLARSGHARKVLQLLSRFDALSAAQLRGRAGIQNQSNLARVVQRLVEAGYATIDRTPDGLPWYGITLRGRAAAKHASLDERPERPSIREADDVKDHQLQESEYRRAITAFNNATRLLSLAADELVRERPEEGVDEIRQRVGRILSGWMAFSGTPSRLDEPLRIAASEALRPLYEGKRPDVRVVLRTHPFTPEHIPAPPLLRSVLQVLAAYAMDGAPHSGTVFIETSFAAPDIVVSIIGAGHCFDQTLLRQPQGPLAPLRSLLAMAGGSIDIGKAAPSGAEIIAKLPVPSRPVSAARGPRELVPAGTAED